MSNNIAAISVKGKYFENESKLVLYSKENERISIIYGKNGSGKSTIAEAFSDYKHGENTEFSKIEMHTFDSSPALLPNEDKQNIFVFDEKYIEDNIRLREDGLSTIVMIGEQVDLDKQIKAVESDIESSSENEKKQKEVCQKYEDSTNLLSPIFHNDAIKTKLKESGGWAEMDSKIKDHKVNTSINDAVIQDIVTCASLKTLDELQTEFATEYSLFKSIGDNQEKYTDEIKTIMIDKNIDYKVLELLSRTIEKPELTEHEKEILDAIVKGSQDRVEDARKYFSNGSTKVCPYCYQPVSEEYKTKLLNSIEKVLNKDVDKHKSELETIKIKKIDFYETKYSKLDINQREKVRTAINSCNAIIEKYNVNIEEKYSNIYTPITLSKLDLFENIKAANHELEQLENLRNAYNKAVDDKSKTIKHLIDLNKQIACQNVDSSFKQYRKQVQDKQVEDKKLSDIDKDIIDKSKNLEELRQKKKNIKIALDNINKGLEYVFFCKGRLSLEEKDDIYYLKSYDNPVKPADISSGERNVIALCYYFTQMLDNLNVKETYTKKYLLIIDDPVSSFDFENKVGIQSYLKSQIEKIILGNKESRVILLSHDLGAVYDFQKAADEVSKEAKKFFSADITHYNMLELENKSIKPFRVWTRHEYTSLIEMVYRYATKEDAQDNELIIGNVMRRVLEAFSTFEYKTGISEISCDKKFLNSLGKKEYQDYFGNLMYRLILNGESHYEESVKALPDMNFFSYISYEEKVRTAKDILCFMFLLNQNHIESHLANIDGATNNIKKWCEEILS